MKISDAFRSTNTCHLPELEDGHKAKFIAKVFGLIVFHTLTLGSVLVYHNIKYHKCGSDTGSDSSNTSIQDRCARSVQVVKVNAEEEIRRLLKNTQRLDYRADFLIIHLKSTDKDPDLVRKVISLLSREDLSKLSGDAKNSLNKVNQDLLTVEDINKEYFLKEKRVIEKLILMIEERVTF